MAAKSPLDNVINLAKRRGFVFQAGEIYGGSRSAWDYGPLGVELKANVKRQWWRAKVQEREDVVGESAELGFLPRLKRSRMSSESRIGARVFPFPSTLLLSLPGLPSPLPVPLAYPKTFARAS